MQLSFLTYKGSTRKISTDIFEGPLDLLLRLIERAELDITLVSLAQVTGQYLEIINNLEDRNADEVSAFLVIAAKLIQIKSEALLPRPVEVDPDEDDPAVDLIEQLKIYRLYKQSADWLAERDEQGLHTHIRNVPQKDISITIPFGEFDIDDLVRSAKDALFKVDPREELGTVVTAPKITIREKISYIVESLKRVGETTFRKLMGTKYTRLDKVVTFLALLELVKQQYIDATQESLFGDIKLLKTDEWDESLEFELEFGE